VCACVRTCVRACARVSGSRIIFMEKIKIFIIINKYKYHRRLNFGLAVYTAADLGAQL